MGKRLLAALEELYNLPNVGEVRGLGMMCGIELVADKSTKAPALGLGVKVGARGDGARPPGARPARQRRPGDGRHAAACRRPCRGRIPANPEIARLHHRRDAVTDANSAWHSPAKAGTDVFSNRAPDSEIRLSRNAWIYSLPHCLTGENMPTRTIGIVIDGATGRLGTTQHLRALLAIRGEGGRLANGERLMPEPLLLGRDPQKLEALAEQSGGLRWSLERDACLADPGTEIYFDAARPAAGSCAAKLRLMRASTSISKSRSRRASTTRCRWLAPPKRPEERAASCRTNCSCPVLRSYANFMRLSFSDV